MQLNRVLTAGMVFLACAWPGAGRAAGAAAAQLTELPRSVQSLLRSKGIDEEGLSVFAQAVDEPRPLLAVAADTPRNPASVMKLVTTLVGLLELGPAHRWKTSVYADAQPRDGRIDGNLYFRGGGDPYLVTEELWKLLRRLRDGGVREISGDLVIDNSYLDIDPQDPGDFDHRPYRPYNVVPEATLVNFGATRFSFWPDREAGAIRITLDPPSSVLDVRNELRLVKGRCRGRQFKVGMRVLEEAEGRAVRFYGDYPTACGAYSLVRAVATSPLHQFGAIQALWRELGGTLEGGARIGTVPKGAQRLMTWQSPTLAEIIRSMNKFSNNVMTRLLLLALGVKQSGEPGTVENGREAVRTWMRRHGIDPAMIHIDNGAGLSRDARVTARALGKMLLLGYEHPLMAEFVSSLPVSAIDGTMRKRFRSTPLAGRMHMKTGLIDHVRALAGYLVGGNGKIYVVVILHNRPGVHRRIGTDVQNALLKWLYGR